METRKKIIILLVVMAGLVGVVLLLRTFIGKRINFSEPDITDRSPSSTIDKVKEQEFYEAISKAAVTDQDSDGIPDSEEPAYKTDLANSDTDSDGLNDWQEVFIYKTDPVKADTDNDTYTDGYEVRRGFNPNGPGKIQS